MPTKKPRNVRSSRSTSKEKAPPSFSVALLLHLAENKVQDLSTYWKLAENLVDRLVGVIAAASAGNDQAAVWLKAIEKVIHPGKFELPRTKINELASKYETNPQLARGWELTALMSHLSYLVEPEHEDRCSPSDRMVMRKTPTLEGNEELVKAIYATTLKYWKPGSTLQSLAIRMYMDHLEREGITDAQGTISERSLKRDLQAVRDWEKTATDEERYARGLCAGYSLSGGMTFWCQHSEGWKDRRKKVTTQKQGMSKKWKR